MTEKTTARRDPSENVKAADAVIRAVLAELGRGPDTDPVIRAREVVAERDALAALIEQAPHASDCEAPDYSDLCDCWKSTAPATVFAQVSADAVREVKQVIFDSLNGPGRARAHELGIAELIDGHAFRIEREAQR